jgi:transcriptional regulator with XRE-family HTH domain
MSNLKSETVVQTSTKGKKVSHETYAKAFQDAKSNAAYVAESLALDVVTSVWQIMQERGMTQKDLAETVGKNPVYISRLLNGSHNLTLRTIAEILVALGQKARIEITPASAEASEETLTVGRWGGVLPRAHKGASVEPASVTNYEPANSAIFDMAA